MQVCAITVWRAARVVRSPFEAESLQARRDDSKAERNHALHWPVQTGRSRWRCLGERLHS
jgi:hypothetical protein